MGIIRPATPGFLVTLLATVLLGVVSFCVPIIKSVYFLKATLAVTNFNGTITLGTLGYCLDQSNGTTCSSPTVGYEFDPNALLGDDIDFAQIPDVVVKWITYVLVLHIVGFALAAISAFIGLLAHIREFAVSCFSSCIAGFAAAAALLAFIFDLVLFFVIKARVDSVSGASAVIGTAIWLTLAAWLLLVFSGCFYTFGRCCVRSRPSRTDSKFSPYAGATNGTYQPKPVPLETVKYEPDRRGRQRTGEAGLPAFQEHQPLSERVQYLDEEEEIGNTYAPAAAIAQPKYPGGYVPAPVTPAHEYPPETTYPPAPARQASQHTQAPSNTAYAISPAPRGNTTSAAPTQYAVPGAYPPGPSRETSQHTQGFSDYSTAAVGGMALGQRYTQSPPAQEYGHTAGGTTYHSAGAHSQYPTNYSDNYNQPAAHQQYPTSYTMPDAYDQQQLHQQYSTNYSTVPDTGFAATAIAAPIAQHALQPPNTNSHDAYSRSSQYSSSTQPAWNDARSYVTESSALSYGQPQPNPHPEPTRSYTLSGNGYGNNVVPDPYAASGPSPLPSQPQAQLYGAGGRQQSQHTLGLDTNTQYSRSPPLSLSPGGTTTGTGSPIAPRPPGAGGFIVTNSSAGDGYPHNEHDSPPQYEEGSSSYQRPAAWAEKAGRPS